MQLFKSLFMLSSVTSFGVLAAAPKPQPVIDKGTAFTCFDLPGFPAGWCASKIGTPNGFNKKVNFYTIVGANQVGAKNHLNYNCEGLNQDGNKCCKSGFIPKFENNGYAAVSDDDCQTKAGVPKTP
ncbi:hypothetical protein PTTG_27734 [Puccinia triticina 1-1 BBBD Race 1]|uniref:Secreted protein n=2 Tax=Puccinia triticina TaxID=208348 RepID=A0A180GI66_PUCT1|nr:uncharacterized protein PtA15_3A263 [Puccinia triticina]OAV92169.1 hypothetical protein PTTG_27734 [Puccinia triticina 1-1 BBBD Race 1]WAQ82898.1 hypothetical protein PtA15_3A263 [Puccinia triticina]WAR53725.1 hypothetical protein PtB15_3B234 [Puccinia triticina]